jgi:hypothetical protein
MQATVTIQVPEGTDVLVLFIPRARPQRKEPPLPVPLALVAPPDPQRRSPRGPQLWLPYAGHEADAIEGARLLEF